MLSTTMAVADDDRTITGPVSAEVIKVRDGDTLEVEAHIWPQQTVKVAVRLRGIDAPELRAKCEGEKAAALAARDRLTALIGAGLVALHDVSGDKYFGRVLARVSALQEADVGARLLREGLVVPYGGKARRDWCTDPLSVGSIFPWLREGSGGR